MWSSSTAHPPTSQLKALDPVSFRALRKARYDYPPFMYPVHRHECLDSITLPRIRENCILVRTLKPEGFTKAGLFVNAKKGPAIWAHILAFHPNVGNYTHVPLIPGDMILFHRYSDDVILEAGDLTLSIVHIKSVQALFSPPLVDLCIS
jgi:hypothetical protein